MNAGIEDTTEKCNKNLQRLEKHEEASPHMYAYCFHSMCNIKLYFYVFCIKPFYHTS
jgi:hypothetical protein